MIAAARPFLRRDEHAGGTLVVTAANGTTDQGGARLGSELTGMLTVTSLCSIATATFPTVTTNPLSPGSHDLGRRSVPGGFQNQNLHVVLRQRYPAPTVLGGSLASRRQQVGTTIAQLLEEAFGSRSAARH